jgi:NAD(P)-dependent dehydrogenase (short-subunit alcohol dehydrogenase family)
VTDAARVIAFAAIDQSFGPVDLLVNNASTPGPVGPLWETDPVECWQAMDVNLRGPLFCARGFAGIPRPRRLRRR